jgi:uncharacterized oligopeptide transporter (OPT) family protein
MKPKELTMLIIVWAIAVSPTTAIRPALVAFALFITAIVFACATISNDNLQHLKTGQWMLSLSHNR